jgi:hypothetical protein
MQTRAVPGLRGQLASMEILGVTPSVSPARLIFDGVVVEPCESKADSSSAGILGASPKSAKIVPELENGVDSSNMGKSGASPVEAEELNFTLDVGEIVLFW